MNKTIIEDEDLEPIADGPECPNCGHVIPLGEAHADKARRKITSKIALRSDHLVDALFAIAEDPDADAKVRLVAIGMLLDRGIPKLGVDHSKSEEVEESSGRKAIREEIESLLSGD